MNVSVRSVCVCVLLALGKHIISLSLCAAHGEAAASLLHKQHAGILQYLSSLLLGPQTISCV
jgi:hypothetical protein